MPSSSVTKKAEEVLDEVLETIRQEHQNLTSVLCETDLNKFVEEEESLRKQLKEMVESESNGWRSFVGLTSPQAEKCLQDAEEFRQRVKEDINAKLRTRFSGRSNPPLPSILGQGSAFNLMDARTPETDTGLPPADGTVVTSPLNMRCSLSELSGLNFNPAFQNDHDYTSDLNDAINTPLETSRDRSCDSSIRRQRRSPPPPPPIRRMAQSSNPHLLLKTASNLGSDSPRRSHTIRRPAPPPPQSTVRSRTPRSPINGSFPSPGSLPPNTAVMSSISQLTQEVDALVSSLVKDGLPRQPRGRHTKTNCIEINNSNADGVTLNNNATNCSGAVIHKTVLPPRLPQHVPPF